MLARLLSFLALATAASAGGTLRHETIDAPSLGDRQRSVRVYLPPSYDLPASRERRYPVVYLLHGWPGGDGNWPGSGRAGELADSLIARHSIPEVILVFPNGAGRGLLGRSLWINGVGSRSRLEDFVVHDLVSWVDSTYRTKADARHRGIIGLSDGATGAFNDTFRHPDVFGACGGHSGTYRLVRDAGVGGIVGSGPEAARRLAANSPALEAAAAAPRLRGHVLYFDCGLDDESLGDNRAFDRTLDSLGVAHTYREYPGSHTWRYWRTHLADSLIAVTSGMW